MIRQSLNQYFQMHKMGNTQWYPAVVPGSVYGDLLANGLMENPFWKDNEDRVLPLMEEDYEYKAAFSCPANLLTMDQVLLRFEGLDTIGDVYLNGILLGSVYNMHRVWEFNVSKYLREKDNELKVVLHSPLNYIRQAFLKCPTLGTEDGMEGFVHIRKAHYMFGWDWGAHLPDAGIFRPVWLLGMDKARIGDVLILQEHENGVVRLSLEINVEAGGLAEAADLSYQVELIAPDQTTEYYPASPRTITVKKPLLWWPAGYGEQHLYSVKVTLFSGEQAVDTWEKRIGLRRVTMKREQDQWGESFAHEVNGVTVFAMGADYIPEDHLLGRVTPETTRQLLLKARFANFNTIRVWGGGYYPEDWFYDICDELGLLVWQDFMFACAVYELTPEFEANIRREFIENVKRLRHHASLGLWCGNNEMEQFVFEKNSWLTKASEVRDYFLMFERIIPEILHQYDPQAFYWPASPSSGGCLDQPNDPDRGDVHFWAVWHGNRPFTEYRNYFFRYASEFGFQAFPSKKTIETFTDDPADWNAFSYIMEKHQRQYGANGKIMGYMQQIYKYPSDFNTFIYASQLLQADAIRYGVEHFRRNRGRCMGAIYWQLNDCWPVVSWSSVDYEGRLKALHYFARRFFAPLMISCEEQGMMSAEADMNREHFTFEKSIRLCVANETMVDEKLTARWTLRDTSAQRITDGEETLHVPSLSSVWLPKVCFPDADLRRHYVSYELLKGKEIISEGTVNFSYPKYFCYENPKLSTSVSGDYILVSACAYAKSVEIRNEKDDLILSDNFFDMNGGVKRVKVLSGRTDGLCVRSVFDIR